MARHIAAQCPSTGDLSLPQVTNNYQIYNLCTTSSFLRFWFLCTQVLKSREPSNAFHICTHKVPSFIFSFQDLKKDAVELYDTFSMTEMAFNPPISPPRQDKKGRKGGNGTPATISTNLERIGGAEDMDFFAAGTTWWFLLRGIFIHFFQSILQKLEHVKSSLEKVDGGRGAGRRTGMMINPRKSCLKRCRINSLW